MPHRPIPSRLLAGLVLVASLSGAAQAALIDRGGGLIYDTDLDVTWLADANYAQTSGYKAGGLMTWSEAVTWADNLTYGGYSDWRLPSPDWGLACRINPYDCSGSEMGRLFYTEGGLSAGQSILADPPGILDDYFINMQPYAYWTGEEYDSSLAWSFHTDVGAQHANFKSNGYYAWAVRPGDVAAVPEAQTYALMLAGLGLVGWRARRRG